MSYQFKKILVPIDLSETSLNAFQMALALAIKNKARLDIINVNEKIFAINGRNKSHSSDHANPDVLNALLGTLVKNNIDGKILQMDGTVIESVISAAVERKPDMIIMGMHGASGFREGFMGTNAYGIAKYASCPVLLLPSKIKPRPFNKILFPVLPIAEALNCYEILRHIIDTSAALEVFGLSSLKMERRSKILDEIVSRVKPQLVKDNVEAFTSWTEAGPVADEILRFSKLSSPGVIVLTSMIDAVSRLDFIGPHTQKILNCSRVPLLCIK